MLLDASPLARAGDLVFVYSRSGEYFGQGLFDPLARMPLRVYHHHHHQRHDPEFDPEHSFGEAGLTKLLQSAIDLRLKVARAGVTQTKPNQTKPNQTKPNQTNLTMVPSSFSRP